MDTNAEPLMRRQASRTSISTAALHSFGKMLKKVDDNLSRLRARTNCKYLGAEPGKSSKRRARHAVGAKFRDELAERCMSGGAGGSE
jgi:hypothetical protein